MSTPETQAVQTKQTAESITVYTPFGVKDPVKLSITIVRNFIATPTKAGHMPTDRDIMRFIMLCKTRLLNPFDGDAFMVGYDSQDGPTFSLITAHQAFLKRAEEHPNFDGMVSGIIIKNEDGSLVDREGDFHLPEEHVVGGWATVHRKDRKFPIHRRIRIERFNKGFGEWKKDPAGMVCKCFDPETEVLTSLGFEKFCNAEGRIMQVTDVGIEPTDSVPFSQEYSGPMVNFKSRNGQFTVTPNHDMPISLNGADQKKMEASELLKLKRRDEAMMPLCITGSGSDEAGLTDRDLQLAAVYLADGSDNSRSAGFSVSVSRTDKLAFLNAVGGFTSSAARSDEGRQAILKSGRVITTKSDKVAFYYSRTHGFNRIVSRGKVVDMNLIPLLSMRQAKLMLDTWMAFDGNQPTNLRIGRIYTSRPDHVRAIELLAVSAGYCINKPVSRISEGYKPNFYLTVSDRKTVNVNASRGMVNEVKNKSGEVWCVTVPSGTIVVRRNGFSAVCHQCAEADSLRSAFPNSLGGMYMDDREEAPWVKTTVDTAKPVLDVKSNVVQLPAVAVSTAPPPVVVPAAKVEQAAVKAPLPPLSNQGPKPKGAQTVPKPGPVPTPMAAAKAKAAAPAPAPTPAPEPTPEPAQEPEQAPSPESDPQPEGEQEPPVDQATEHADNLAAINDARSWMENNGVTFGDFRNWLVNAGHYNPAENWTSTNDITAEVWLKLAANEKIMKRCVTLYGKSAEEYPGIE